MRVDPSLSPDDQAVEWLVHLHSGHADGRARAAYHAWRKADPAHEQAARAAETLWLSLGHTGAARHHRAARRVWSVRPMAAALAAAMAFLAVLWSWPPAGDYRTTVGERREVALSDGSRVSLNTDTVLDVRFTEGERRVELRRGEAVFQVAKDSRRPFLVVSQGVVAQALGTVYGVRRVDDLTRVAVLEGVVKVSGGGTALTLTAGQKTSLGDDGGGVAQSGDVAAETAWLRGKLIVNNMPLGQVMRQLGRHRQGLILVTGDVRDMPVSAVLDLDDDDALYAALEGAFGVKVSRLPLLTLIRR